MLNLRSAIKTASLKISTSGKPLESAEYLKCDVLNFRLTFKVLNPTRVMCYHIPASSHKRHSRQKAQSDVTHEDWFHMVSGKQ